MKRTKGSRSESERVNSLLKLALNLEKKAALYEEAGSFFSHHHEDRDERRPYESARTGKPPRWHPKRDEICLFALDKERPGLVISSDALNIHSLDVCVVPISTAEHKAFSLKPKLKAGEGGLDKDSWVKCDQITTIEKTRAVYPPLGSLSRNSLVQIEEAVKRALELP